MNNIRHMGNTCVVGYTNFLGNFTTTEVYDIFCALEKVCDSVYARDYGYRGTLNTHSARDVFNWKRDNYASKSTFLVEFTIRYEDIDKFKDTVMRMVFRDGDLSYCVEPWRRSHDTHS